MSEGRSPRSVARSVACYRGFYRFLLVDGRVRANPAEDLHPPRGWKVLPRYLSVEDVDRLIAQPDVKTPRGLRDRAVIELMYATGMRVSELVMLRPADVHLEASYLTCTGKGDKQRIVPIGDEASAWVSRNIWIQFGMSAFTGLLTIAAIIARIYVQQKVSGDMNGKPPEEG